MNSGRQRVLLWMLFIAALGLIITRLPKPSANVKRGPILVHWVAAADAERAAEMAKRPILYEFSAEWCGPCHRLEDEVFRDAALAAMINEGFVPVKLVDRRRETGSNPTDVAKLQQAYGVRAFPTIVVVHEGREPVTLIGFRGRTHFEGFLREAR